MARVKNTPLPHITEYPYIFIEYLGLDYVISNLEKMNLTWMVNNRYQKGFDLTVIEGIRNIKIEIKSRGIGEYSGIVNESETQKNSLRRHFNFSKSQVKEADFFICVFVGPIKRSAIIIPRKDFTTLEVRTNKTRGRITATEGNPLIKSRSVSISRWIEAWDLIK